MSVLSYQTRVACPSDRRLPAPAVQNVDVRVASAVAQQREGGR